MADDQQLPDPDAAGAISDLAQGIVDAVLDPKNQEKVKRAIQDIQLEVTKDHAEFGFGSVAAVLDKALKIVFEAIDLADPVYAHIGKIALDSLMGGRNNAGVPDDIGARVVEKITGGVTDLQPDTANALRFVSLFAKLEIEAWSVGVVTEVLSEFVPHNFALSTAGIETVSQLREVVASIFGGTRIMRRILGPFVAAAIVTPTTWATNKQYRPTLLGAGAAIEALLRGDWTADQVNEELARQGWSDDRIAVQIANAQKRLSFDDLVYRHFRGELADTEVVTAAQALGYDEPTATLLLAIADLKRIDALNAPVVTEAVAAFVAGDIDEPTMAQWVTGAAPNQTDASRIISTAHARRAINVKHITSAQMRALVIDGIAAVPDYMDALAREGYQEPELTYLELSLRKDQDDQHDLDKAKAAKKAADDAKAVQAAADKAAKDAELAAKRARTFPSLAEFRKSYVRGFTDRQTYADELTRENYAPEDAAFLLAGADADREQYLADQAAAAAKAADHADKGLSVATLEQAVLRDILTIGDFDSALVKANIPDDDRALLVKVMQSKLDDQADAETKRVDAEKLAAAKGVSLSTWERAVRLGVRSLAEYGDFLTSIGTTAPSKALILDVLGAQLAADQAAQAKRAANDAAAAGKGISLAQRRRAVIAGVRPKQYYAQALIDAGWPVDDQLADLDLLDVEIAAHQDAEDKAAAAAAKMNQSTLTVAQLDKALGLGLITQTEYAAAVTARGATADDAALLLQLALAGVPDTVNATALHAQVTAELAGKGVALADLESAVRRGLVTLAAFSADLANRGYSVDAVDLLTQLLQDKIDLDVDGLTKKIDAALGKVDGAPARADLETAFDAGTLDATALQGVLTDNGVARDVALVYVRLLAAGDAQE